MSHNMVFYDNYTPVGDLIVIAIVLVILVLIFTSYVKKTRNFKIFVVMLFFIFVASYSNIFYHVKFLSFVNINVHIIYILRFIYHFSLYADLLLYVVYVTEMMQLEKNKKKYFVGLASVGFIILVIVEYLGTRFGYGFRIGEYGATRGAVIEGFNIFILGYIYFCSIVLFILIRYRDRLYGLVVTGFYGTMAISFSIIALQGINGQSSFTTATFMFPAIAMMYLLHSNPYDIKIGAVNASAMEDHIKDNYSHGREFVIMSLYMRQFDDEGKKFPEVINKTIRKFAGNYFRAGILFQISNGHVILIADKKKNPDFENKTNIILNDFFNEYAKYRYDFKIVMGDSLEEISRRNEYVSFIKHIHSTMNENEVHFITYDDVSTFNREKYILDELGDIYRRRDMNDPRVAVYCQPVYNIEKHKYDTAEALMRLNLPQIGMVFPDQFIQLAEDNQYIHVLSLIILKKTCDEIRKLIVSGYEVNRISVNISVIELRDDDFCNDINKIIKDSGIPEGKIAIEITESQNENDFIIMKAKINELKSHGIKLYLDDFGTGYSNLERIMELPFDIIKFDRSLVLASGDNEKSKKMVGNLASMFSDMDYSVLYEGIENELDEKRCIAMSAIYLQGYKYSRPIPIEQLTEFFDKNVG